MFETDKLNAYLREAFDDKPHCGSVAQIFGGASRDTYRVELLDANERLRREVIVRLPQPSGLIDTDQTLEYYAYTAFADSDVPVPKVLAMDASGDILGRPFLMLELLPGDAGNPFARDFYAAVAEPVGQAFWTILGRIGAAEKALAELAPHFEALGVEDAWSRELEHWLAIYADKKLGPDPLFEAAVRWLRRNPPRPSGAPGVVHGDYRMGTTSSTARPLPASSTGNSAGHSIASGANPYPGYLNGAWLAADLHRTEMLELMQPVAKGAA